MAAINIFIFFSRKKYRGKTFSRPLASSEVVTCFEKESILLCPFGVSKGQPVL